MKAAKLSLLCFVAVVGCRAQEPDSVVRVAPVPPINESPIDPNAPQDGEVHPIEALRHYCKACHAIGEQRFLTDKSDAEIWHDLFVTEAPDAQVIWAKQIVKVLSWPAEIVPSQQAEVSPGKRFMPIGSKRNAIATTKIGGKSARLYIIDVFKTELEKRGIE